MVLLLVLAGCGGSEPVEDTADSVDQGADDSADDSAETGSQDSAQSDSTEAATADLLAAASEEGEINWYVSMPTTGAEALAQVFQEQHPDITVNIQRQPTFEVWERIRTEAAAELHTADVFSFNGFGVLSQAKDEGLITPYLPANVDEDIDASFVDQDGYSFGARVTCLTIVYNSDMVSEDEAPESWNDLTDQAWGAGQIASGDPAEQVLALDLYWHMLQSEDIAQAFFDGLGQNEPRLYTQGGQLVNAVISGEVPVGITWDYAGYTAADDGAPIEVVYPTEGVACSGDEHALLTEAPHPNAAKVFLDFLASAEAGNTLAEAMGVYPAHQGASAAQADRPPLSTLPLLPRDPERQLEEQDAFNAMFDEVIRRI